MKYLGHLGVDPLTETALTSVAQVATSNPDVIMDRARAAALADYGYGYLDVYTQYQPLLFFVSLAGLAASGYGLYARPKKPEIITLYSLTAVLSAASAWFTRPRRPASHTDACGRRDRHHPGHGFGPELAGHPRRDAHRRAAGLGIPDLAAPRGRYRQQPARPGRGRPAHDEQPLGRA